MKVLLSLASAFAVAVQGSAEEIRMIRKAAPQIAGFSNRAKRRQERKEAHRLKRRATWGPNNWKVR